MPKLTLNEILNLLEFRVIHLKSNTNYTNTLVFEEYVEKIQEILDEIKNNFMLKEDT